MCHNHNSTSSCIVIFAQAGWLCVLQLQYDLPCYLCFLVDLSPKNKFAFNHMGFVEYESSVSQLLKHFDGKV